MYGHTTEVHNLIIMCKWEGYNPYRMHSNTGQHQFSSFLTDHTDSLVKQVMRIKVLINKDNNWHLDVKNKFSQPAP